MFVQPLRQQTAELELLSPEEVAQQLERYREQHQQQMPTAESTPEAFLEALKYFNLLIHTGAYQRAAEWLRSLENPLQGALEMAEQGSDTHTPLIELKLEWNTLVMRFLSPRTDEFSEYPYFAEGIALTDKATGMLHMRHLQLKLGLVNNYLQWLTMGGNREALPDAQRAYLNELYQNIEQDTRASIKRFEEADEYSYSIPLKRSLGRFLMQTTQHKAGFELLEEVVKDIAQHPDYSTTDEADLRMEVGQLLAHFEQTERALEHFRTAHTQYQAAGEDFEIFAAQAEGWVEELEAQQG